MATTLDFTTMKTLTLEGYPLKELYIDDTLVWKKSTFTNLHIAAQSRSSGESYITNTISYTYPQVIRLCFGQLESCFNENNFEIHFDTGTYSGEAVDPYYSAFVSGEEVELGGATGREYVITIDPTSSYASAAQTATSVYFVFNNLGPVDAGGHPSVDDDLVITLDEEITSYNG